jgi:hypothetical protein
MMQAVMYNIRYVHNDNKRHLQKQNQTNNTQHRICEIHVSRYIIFVLVFLCKVCARRLETKTYLQKQNQTSNKQNIEYVKYMYMYQAIFL